MSVKYTKDHEWVKIDGEDGVVGITAYAAEQLGDVVFVELPEVGASFAQGDEMAVVESVKAASEVYAPVAGEVIAVNDALEGEPQKVNESPDGEGWFVKLKLTEKEQLDGLMDDAAYKAHIA
ncbi:glycine cleavage system protein GcvH [Hyphobacterium sp.]|uniref:glycine cleavage system protein GcvH n=1 Tax=Hyphobacterium sp. TaxID=2004662 RepID=UPI003BAB67DD